MLDTLCSFSREYVMFTFTKSLLFYPVNYVPHTGRRFTVSYEMKTNVTWIYSASHFASVEGAQGFIVGFIFALSRANGKPQRPIWAKKDIYCLDTAEFIDRVCSLRGMNKEELKVKMGVNHGKSFLKVCPPWQWSTTTMTLNCTNPLRRALHLSFPVRKGCCFKNQRHT